MPHSALGLPVFIFSALKQGVATMAYGPIMTLSFYYDGWKKVKMGK